MSSKGDKDIPNLLKDKDLYISFISEMELLSFPKLNTEEKIKIKSLLNDLFILEFNSEIKETAIDLRSKYNTSLPDSIILASSLFLNLPVMSADKDFKKIKEINFIMLER
ncbi:MAG: PIN domain-containing protein [Cyclobacteriaceae bacterium]|nr:PIN domain-containing protein [Cyclobacteriaceae bacterium]